MKKPKFKIGDKVYSWQNPTVKRPILRISKEEPPYEHRYQLRLKRKNGSTYNSKWTNESSLSKRRKK